MRHLIETLKASRKMQGLILLLVALIVADAGFYVLRVRPASEKVLTLQERLDSLQKGVAEREAEYGRYAAYQKSLADMDKFKEVLPGRSEYASVLEQVYRLAREDRMASGTFRAETADVKQEGDLAQLTFAMPITGRYSDVRKFIYDVEASRLFLNINSLGLSKAEGEDTITLNIGLSTYVRL